MNFTVDFEFNGYGGELLSMGLYSPNHSLYVLFVEEPDAPAMAITPWVQTNVVPLLKLWPRIDEKLLASNHCATYAQISRKHTPAAIEHFFQTVVPQDETPHIHTDWPDDVKYFSELLLTGPGTMIGIPGIKFTVHRVDSYPTELPGAMQHHAWCDARVLYQYLLENCCLDTL